jgi:hypothetical protein
MVAAGVMYGGIVAIKGFKPPYTTDGWVAIVATGPVLRHRHRGLYGRHRTGRLHQRGRALNRWARSSLLLVALLVGEAVEPLRLVVGLFYSLSRFLPGQDGVCRGEGNTQTDARMG